ncbi:MAG TPA: ROK family protein [Bryobacteraceae bacterium]|jgi:predicted NBD/HSP70 family sugar kinase|nr:ROK family protein [Bryobacteraceae bacterium]
MRATSNNRVQVASSEGVRDINRRAVLNLIRTKQPISRADLARISGLQRSTISLIVEDLIAGHWVLEGPTGRLPRGRRPTFLRLNDDRVIIGVDIRPLQITVALADVNGKFTSQEVMPTVANPKTAIDGVIARIQRLLRSCGEKKVEGIGISLPGRVEPGSGRLIFAPNLKWTDFDIADAVHKATGFDVEMENAANACVLAAVWFDHIESRNLVVVTVSEGIGTGVLVNGRLARGFSGMAGEFGHVPLDPDGPLCSCGSRGCWEVFGSNRAALRYYFESRAQTGLNFQDLLSLADQGDHKAAKALETMAHFLGRGMRMIVAALDPEQIVIIGDLTRSWHRFGPVIQAEVQAQGLSGGVAPKLIPVHEDGMARLRGTVALVLQKHFGVTPEVPA